MKNSSNTSQDFHRDWRRHSPPKLIIRDDPDLLFEKAADLFLELIQNTHMKKDRFNLVVGGGRTPVKLNRMIIKKSKSLSIAWRDIFVYFSDERCVAPQHIDSNYGMMNQTFIEPLGIPQKNIYRIRGEISSEFAATEYWELLKRNSKDVETYMFDLALMGMGQDGHTASLFPGTGINYFSDEWVKATGTGPEGYPRISLLPVILNRAQNMWFIIAGAEKYEALNALLYGAWKPDKCPAQLIRPYQGSLIYFLERKLVSA